MSISSINDNSNSSILNGLFNTNNQKTEAEESLFAASSSMAAEYEARKREEEATAAAELAERSAKGELTQEDFEGMILSQSDFSNNVMSLIKNGFSMTDAVKETRQEQYEDLFAKRLSENGGDVVEATNYAKSMMGSELTDEELYEAMQNTAKNYEMNNADVANQLKDLANELYEKMTAEKQALLTAGSDEMKAAADEKIFEDKATASGKSNKTIFTSSLSVDKSLQKLMFNPEDTSTSNSSENANRQSFKSIMV